MATDAQTPIERIKQKLDIVDEIGAVVSLKKSGKAYKGLCPFHGERTPSFYVFPDNGTYHCFGCHEYGDIFSFVQKQQNLDFGEALALLAERAGVALGGYGAYGGERDGAESADAATRKRLRALNETAAIWFHHQLLQATEAQYARTYIDSRGVSNESLALWRLGFAPEGDALTRYLMSEGYTPKELIDYGFTREREASKGGGLYDYFRNRLIFPIRDARGQTIAFGGRELAGGQVKYLNSPQTLLFDKSATLYGLDLARDGIKKGDRVVLVEGYMDAIVTHQYGFRNVVAVIGSAVTEKHIRQIKKLTRRVTLALDPDAAGESATARGIIVAQQAFDRVAVPVPTAAPGAPTSYRPANPNQPKQPWRKREPQGLIRFEEQVDAEITVARLPAHEDPDEFVRRDTEGWRRAIAQAQPLIDFLIEARTADLALDTPQGKLEARRRLLPIIAETRDRTLADDYVGRLAQKLRVDKIDLRLDLSQLRQRLDREARNRPTPPDHAPGAPGGEASHDSQAPSFVTSSDDPFDDDLPTGSPDTGDDVGGKSQSGRPGGSVAAYSSSGAIGSFQSAPMRGGAGALLAEQALEVYCLGVLLDYPATWAEISAIVGAQDFTGVETRALYSAFADAMRDAQTQGVGMVDGATLLATLHPTLLAVAEQAQARVVEEAGGVPEGVGPAKVARDSAYRLKRMRLKAQMAELDALQRDAEQGHDAETLRTLLMQKQRLLAERRAVDAASALFG